MINRLITACCFVSLLGIAGAQTTTIEDFEGGTNDGVWAFDLGSSLPLAGGNPNAYLEGIVNFTAAYAQASTTASSSVFLGDWKGREVMDFSVDVNELANAFGASLTVSLVLHNDSGTPIDPSDDCLVWTTNNTDPTGQGWITESFFIDSLSPVLPSGWNHNTLTGTGCATGDAAWMQVIGDVTKVTIFFGRPIDLIPFSDTIHGVDNISITEGVVFTQINFCNGDGGDQMGCTNCPCSNNSPFATIGGCLNSASTSTRLDGSGDTSVSLPSGDTTDLRFGVSGAPAGAFCILNSGDAVAPQGMANPCFGLNSGAQSSTFDGLRCAVQNTLRHGGRSADGNGEVGVTNNPWGGEGGPPIGLAVAGGFASGQTRYFQVIHRDDPLAVCGRGLNTSQAVEVTFTP